MNHSLHQGESRAEDGIDIVPPGNSARKGRPDDANLGAFRRRLAYCCWARERHRSVRSPWRPLGAGSTTSHLEVAFFRGCAAKISRPYASPFAAIEPRAAATRSSAKAAMPIRSARGVADSGVLWRAIAALASAISRSAAVLTLCELCARGVDFTGRGINLRLQESPAIRQAGFGGCVPLRCSIGRNLGGQRRNEARGRLGDAGGCGIGVATAPAVTTFRSSLAGTHGVARLFVSLDQSRPNFFSQSIG